MLGKLFKNMITINGKQYETFGGNIEVCNNRVFVNGEEVSHFDSGNTRIVVYGDVNSVKCTGSVEVSGNCGSVDCGGSCSIGGSVTGDIDAGGSVTCGNVTGDIDAGGSVRCKRY